MALDLVNTGSSPNDHSGDLLRDGFIKINANLEYLEDLISSGATQVELTDAIENIEAHLDVIRAEIDTKVTIGASIPLDRIIGLVNALNSKVNKSTFNSAIGNINNLISQIQEVIAELQRGSGLDHNSLSGLQGGDEVADEFYHLKLSELTRLKALIYEPSVSTISVSPTSGERGLSTAVSATYNIKSNDDVITMAMMDNGIGSVLSNVNAGNITVPLGNKVVTTSATIILGYTRNGVSTGETISATYNAYVPQWVGTSATADFSAYTAINTALQKFVQSSATLQRNMSPTNQYLWFVSNKNNATVLDQNNFTQTVGNWGDDTTEFWRKSLTLTLADGVTTSTVYLYRTRLTKNFTNIIYKIQ